MIEVSFNDEGQPSHLRITSLDLSDECFETAVQIKIGSQRHHMVMKEAQKLCGKDDRDYARFFAEESKDNLKYYRAACFLIGTLRPDSYGDCPALAHKAIPLELERHLRNVDGWSQYGLNPWTCN